jgi:carbon monoxide dehydrogenase subunit G
MITIENVLAVEKDIESVWKFFNDVSSIAGCVPTCKSFRVVDENTVDCDLRLKLGLIPLDSKARVMITDRSGSRHLEARGETEPGEVTRKFGKVATETKTKLHIILNLDEDGPNKTKVHFQINADAMGQMKRIYESIISGQRAKLEAQFVANVEKVLGAKVVIEGMPKESLQAVSAQG